MKKLVYLSLACAAILNAAEVEIDTISVESTTLEGVSGHEIKSADVAEALAKKVPSISLVRRSGIANDIILRGQKKDNINVLIDDGKICGACPNRMDPTTSHIVNNNIESIEIIEGPYDVENFGTLSGAVKIKTKEPTEDVHGSFNFNAGSFDYNKISASVSGGTENFRILLSASDESSGQYRDGDGNNFAEQIDNYIANSPDPTLVAGAAMQDQYRDMQAYSKKSFMGKLFFDITDDQELRFGYTMNRSSDILYPSSKMDAIFDDSNLYTAEYIVRNIGTVSKELDIQYYYSDVEHPMSTKYRVAATGPMGEMTSHLTTSMQGAKLKNLTELTDNLDMTLGLDASVRNWDGIYFKNGTDWPLLNGAERKSMDDVDTTNLAFFAELEQQFSSLNVKYGLRYDDTNVKPANSDVPLLPEQPDNHYTALNANIFANHQTTENLSFFGGVGKSSRVPDARELYFHSSMNPSGADAVEKNAQVIVGTPDLKQTINYEADLGMKNSYKSFTLKTKLFYSMLKDYIYFNSKAPKVQVNSTTFEQNAFENIDATIYGFDISGSYYAFDNLYADFGVAYQRGQKDEPLAGQTDKDLAEIPPFKGNVALNYVYYQENTATVEFIGAGSWNNYDSDNGEQELSSWGIMNLKVDHRLSNGFGLAVGVDNVLDKTYAVSNTYKDLTLLYGGGDVMLMNEPGRYYYVNASYQF
ncbi:MAG: TonB-dependent receptor [Campylobacterota bacterium]